MIDIDAEFRRVMGSTAGTSTNNQDEIDEPLTLEKIRDAMAQFAEVAKMPNEIRVQSLEDFKASLHPIQLAKFNFEDPFRSPIEPPKRHFGGIPIIADEQVPSSVACMAINGRIVRVIPLSPEARPAAQRLAKALEASDE